MAQQDCGAAAAPNDGGPAFPVTAMTYASPVTVAEGKRMALGMSLRDYAAVHLHYDPEGMSVAFAEHLVGRPMPRAGENKPADPIAVALFWLDVEVAYRVAAAEAFLRARKAGVA